MLWGQLINSKINAMTALYSSNVDSSDFSNGIFSKDWAYIIFLFPDYFWLQTLKNRTSIVWNFIRFIEKQANSLSVKLIGSWKLLSKALF